jgi:hypothetical protein
MSALEQVKKHLVPGKTYRRSDFAELTSNVDRHIHSLLVDGHLKRLSMGIYLAPKMTAFGEALPDEHSLLKTFLKDDHFVVYSTSQFNSLRFGTTQLYNERVVFNRKRTGQRQVGGRNYTFRLWREAPKSISIEFLVVELLNRLDDLVEDHVSILKSVKSKLSEMDSAKLNRAAKRFGTLSSQKKLKNLLQQQKK